MAILKCKMCGGDVELVGDKTFGTCEYCGCTMTFPKVDDEQRAAAFNRGNHFRRIGEFDKALAVYERIVQEDDTDAEAHWCCALCRFGIEYVEDPVSMEWMPTCHRASFDSFLEDVDYLAAVKHSAGITQRQYQKDAAKIADVQRGILATSQNTEPYDVFICYKETDDNGNRTKDSMLAQDIYYQLVEQGRKVFFSRITLEDVAGTQYEPYIFAALNSARVMIVVGTKPENLSAVWVKNEWSRFLSLMKKDHSKLLLPCYRDMDPYDLPEQLSVLQSYDMAKIGFIQDLIRGVAKVLDAEQIRPATRTVVKETVVTGGGQVAPLLKRAFMFLEDGDFEKADEFCEQVLNVDPECAEAYLGKLMAELRVKTREGLTQCALPFDKYNNYQKALRFADDSLRNELNGYIRQIQERNMAKTYDDAVRALRNANRQEDCDKVARMFATLGGYRDAADMVAQCHEKGKALAYAEAERLTSIPSVTTLSNAMAQFRRLKGYRDAEEKAAQCEKRILQIKIEQEQYQHKGKRKRLLILGVIASVLAVAILVFTVVIPYAKRAEMAPQREEIEAYQHLLAAGEDMVVGVYRDGHLFMPVNADIPDFNAVDVFPTQAVALSERHYVFLKQNGTLLSYGDNEYQQGDVEHWRDITAVAVGQFHTVGLQEDGTVVATGWNENGELEVGRWEKIQAIAAGDYHTVGLKEDGTVVATGGNSEGQCNVTKWKHIVAVAAGPYYTMGLKDDGTVVVAGDIDNMDEVSKWEDIVAVAAGEEHIVGLKADGTVVAAGPYYMEHTTESCLAVADWEDIVAIAAGPTYTIGLKSDGTVVCTNDDFNMNGWNLF